MRTWQELAIESAFPGSSVVFHPDRREMQVDLAAPIETWLGRSITSFVLQLGEDAAIQELQLRLHDAAVPYEPSPDYVGEEDEILKRVRAALDVSERRKGELLSGGAHRGDG